MNDILISFLLGIYLAFMMFVGALLGSLTLPAFTRWAAKRKDLSK